MGGLNQNKMKCACGGGWIHKGPVIRPYTITLQNQLGHLSQTASVQHSGDVSRGRPDCEKIDWSISENLERSRTLAWNRDEDRNDREKFQNS